MSKSFTFLFTLFIGLTATAQNSVLMSFDEMQNRMVDRQEIQRIKNLNSTPDNDHSRASTESFMVDYDILDNQIADDNGYDYQGFVWQVNKDYPLDSGNTLNYASVAIKRLISSEPADADYQTEYPYAGATVTVDSVGFIFGHWNNSGTTNRIIMSIVDVQATGEPMANVLWSDTIVTDSSLSPAQTNGIPDLLEFRLPANLAINAGADFGLRLDFEAPLNDQCYILSSYVDECFGACGATPSVVDLNSWYTINGPGLPQPLNPAQVAPVLDATCDAEVRCQEWFLQNHLFRAWVTAEVPFNIVNNTTDNEGCSGDFVQLDVSATGGQTPLTYAWTPTTNLDDASAAAPQAVVGDDDITYTVVVTDANNETVSTTVTVNSRQVVVDLADEALTCGGTLNYIAGTSGDASGASYAWSNQGSQNFANQIDAAGVYSVTVTNGFGCSSTDNGVISISGVTQDPTFAVPNPICAGTSNTFTNTTTDMTGWNFTWDFGDNNLSFTTDGVNTYAAAGNYLLSLTAQDANSCTFRRYQNVLVLPSGDAACQTSTGIEDAGFASSIAIVPNPSNGLFNINIQGLNSDIAISVIDLTGKEIYNFSATNTVDLVKEIDLSDVSNGLYLVKFQSGDDSVVERITIAK